MAVKEVNKAFKLVVPLDASGINGFEPSQALKVVAKDSKGPVYDKTVKLDRSGRGAATFRFKQRPGAVGIFIGPENASNEEILGLQTLRINVSPRRWAEKPSLTLSPVLITPYYWYWWLRWCRKFVIRGRVICPDGNPVPGAEVCALDVDSWFVWSSTQTVGCATTGIDGTFEISFRWCCGWWPWWWWRHRVWQIEPQLIERVGDLLKGHPGVGLSRIDSQPNLAVFDALLANALPTARRGLRESDMARLPDLRNRLIKVLPNSPMLEGLHVWPWYPWQPWWDCRPDIIFRVTQDCESPGEIILEEGIGDTRWNIPTTLDVTLVAEENACCLADCPNPPCEEMECLIVDSVCSLPFDGVGGNPGALPAPAGYFNPGPVPVDTKSYHRPFAGILPIYKNPDTLAGVDYYEIEFYDEAIADWAPLPAGAAVDFHRRYRDTDAMSNEWASFSFDDVVFGRNVVESRKHYEDRSPLRWEDDPITGDPQNAYWLITNYSLLLPLDTTKFIDGTYRFRIVGWQESGGGLINRRVLQVCGSEEENEFVLTFDNRVTTADAGHDPAHNCGEGVHLCTEEPDTHILAVRIDGAPVDICGTGDITPEGVLEVDFMVLDADEHLAFYDIHSKWGMSQSESLLQKAGASVSVISGGPSGWSPGQTSGNYGTALSQGAAAPNWSGGTFRLTIPMDEAFPEPCCYQLVLRAFKRTIVGYRHGRRFGCDAEFKRNNNGNRTEFSLGVGLCSPAEPEPPEIILDAGPLKRS